MLIAFNMNFPVVSTSLNYPQQCKIQFYLMYMKNLKNGGIDDTEKAKLYYLLQAVVWESAFDIWDVPQD